MAKLMRQMPGGRAVRGAGPERAAVLLRHPAGRAGTGQRARGGDGRRRAVRMECRAQVVRSAASTAARPRARVAQHRGRGRHDECMEEPHLDRSTTPSTASSWSNGCPAPESRSRSGAWRTSCSVRSCHSEWPGPRRNFLGDVAFRIPPLTDSDAADIIRDVKAAPLFFGYKGSEPVDVAALEELVLRLSRLKDDLPEVESLDLSLVLAGATGAEVLRASEASPRSATRGRTGTRGDSAVRRAPRTPSLADCRPAAHGPGIAASLS